MKSLCASDEHLRICSYTDKVSLPKWYQVPHRQPWRSALQELRLPMQKPKHVTCRCHKAAPWATQAIQKNLVTLLAACTSVLRASMQVAYHESNEPTGPASSAPAALQLGGSSTAKPAQSHSRCQEVICLSFAQLF